MPQEFDRRTPDVLLVLVQTIQSDVHEMKETLTNHIETAPKEWVQVLEELAKKAFPKGDADGHRRFHEASIKSAESRAQFWEKMAQEITKWGLIGFIFWVLKTLVEAGAIWLQTAGHRG